ncbi:hypothetical protein [Kineococcus sp. NUM-3379]
MHDGRVWPWVFAAHAVLVLGLLTLVGAPGAGAGAGHGSGLAALPLLLLGLPGSLPAVVDPYPLGQAPPSARDVVLYGPAVLNVLLHGLVLVVVRRRSGIVVPG